MTDIYAAPGAQILDARSRTPSYGGLARLPYVLWLVGVQLIGTAIMATIAAAIGPEPGVLVGYLTIALGTVYVNVLRFRNQGASGWWAVGWFVPLLNLYVAVRALAFQEGYCSSGSLDRTGRWVVCGMVSAFALALMALVFLPLYAASS